MSGNRVIKVLLSTFVILVIFFNQSRSSVSGAEELLPLPSMSIDQVAGGNAVNGSIVDANVIVSITNYDPDTNKIFLHADFDYRNVDGLLRDFDASTKQDVSNFEFDWEDKSLGTCSEVEGESAKIQCSGFISRIVVSYDYTQTLDTEPFSVGAGINIPDATIRGNISLEFLSRLTYIMSDRVGPQLEKPGLVSWNSTQDNAMGFYATLALNKSWTLMYYLVEDFEDDNGEGKLSFNAIQNLYSSADDNRNVNITVFRDPLGSGEVSTYDAFEFLVNSKINHEIDRGETNSGDSQTLTNFIKWSQANFPASNYALIIFGHGNISGIGPDITLNYSQVPDCWDVHGKELHCLSPQDLQTALGDSGIDKIDVLYLAACSMATVELAYQLRDVTDYLVASQQLSFMMEENLHEGYIHGNYLTIDSSTSPYQLAQKMAEDYHEAIKVTLLERLFSNATPKAGITISALDLTQISALKGHVDSLSTNLREKMPTTLPLLQNVLDNVQRFNTDDNIGIIDKRDELIDLEHFAYLLRMNTSDPEIKSLAQTVEAALDSVVIYNYSESGPLWTLNNSNGVSTYFPSSCNSLVNETWLEYLAGTFWDFCQPTLAYVDGPTATSNWGAFLSEYIYQTNPNEPDRGELPPIQIIPTLVHDVYLPFVNSGS